MKIDNKNKQLIVLLIFLFLAAIGTFYVILDAKKSTSFTPFEYVSAWTAGSGIELDLQFYQSNQVDHYVIYRATAIPFFKKKLTETKSKKYKDLDVVEGKTYTYYVEAFYVDGRVRKIKKVVKNIEPSEGDINLKRLIEGGDDVLGR